MYLLQQKKKVKGIQSALRKDHFFDLVFFFFFFF